MEVVHQSKSSEWRRALSREAPVLILVALYALFAVGTGHAIGASERVRLLLYPQTVALTVLALGFGFVILLPFWLMIRRHPSPIGFVLEKVGQILARPWDIVTVAVTATAMTIFVAAFTSMKSLIPLIHPYGLDPQFAQIDRWLHAGVDPWQLTHALFATPVSTGVINLSYHLWFVLMWTVWFVFLFWFHRPELRQQFLISFLLVWIVVGSILATTMSSAGPVYFGYIVDGTNPFSNLVERLQLQQEQLLAGGSGLDVWALSVQDGLWASYKGATTAVGSGISAMPSLHVAVATLMALGTWQLSHWLGIAFWLYAAMIQVGSVHLAWHYAIDGYLAAVVTVVIWKLAGWWVRRRPEASGAAVSIPA